MNIVPTAPSSSSSSSLLRRKLQQQQQQTSGAGGGDYNTINLYTETPNFELSIDDFEIYAIKRLKVLKTIEQLRTFGSTPTIIAAPGSAATTTSNAAKFDTKLEAILNDVKLNDPIVDDASHFILRLSYCRTEELRTWFCKYECDLFRYRMKRHLQQMAQSNSNNKNKTVLSLLSQYANVQSITAQEKEQIRTPLLQLMSIHEFTNQTIYKVPFQQVLNLIANRSCFLYQGYVYVPESNIIDIIVNKFRMNLSRDLTFMGKQQLLSSDNSAMEGGMNDPESVRIYPLLHNLDTVVVNREPEIDPSSYGNHSEQITSQTVDSYLDHMPLCMRVLHRGMKQDKKLKYNGRLQYSLFLKGIGVTLDDAITYFQKHFSAVTSDVFTKQYTYSLRHIYGKEGKRESKRPYSCVKIIIGQVAPATSGQYHGCPYKHYDDTQLSALLQQFQIGTAPSDRNEILRLKQTQQYQLACQKHFLFQHPQANASGSGINLENVGNHPNAWFRASLDYKRHNNNSNTGQQSYHSPQAPRSSMDVRQHDDNDSMDSITEPDAILSNNDNKLMNEVSP